MLVFENKELTEEEIEHDYDNICDNFHEDAMPMQLFDGNPHKNRFDNKSEDACSNKRAELLGDFFAAVLFGDEDAVTISNICKNDGGNPGDCVTNKHRQNFWPIAEREDVNVYDGR